LRWKKARHIAAADFANPSGYGYEYPNVPGIRSTQLRRYADKSHGAYYHGTPVVTLDKEGTAYTDTGGYDTKTTFGRMSTYMPHGWRV